MAGASGGGGVFLSGDNRRAPIDFSSHQAVQLSKSSKVLIVGGGPAGLHMAAELSKRGITNVKVLEKSNRTCGKIESPNYNGAVHELGACWLSSSYKWVRALFEEYGIGAHERGPGPKNSRDIIIDPDDYHTVDLKPWMLAEIEKEKLPEPLRALLPDWLQNGNALVGFNKYMRRHHEIAGPCDYNIPPEPTPEHLAIFKKTLRQFLQDEHLDACIPFFSLAQTAQGYGFSQEVMTYYALYWLTPALIQGYIDVATGGPPVPTLLPAGWQQVIEAFHKKHQFPVQLNSPVTDVARGEQGVRVMYRQGADGTVVQEECDYVIFSAPMPQILDYIHPTEKEREIFSSLRPVTIVTHLIDAVDPLDADRQSVCSWPFGLSRAGAGHVYTLKNSLKATTDKSGPGPNGKWSFVTYQLYADKVDIAPYNREDGELPRESAYVTEAMRSDVLHVYHLRDVEVVKRRAYAYFYHFDADGLEKKYPWEIMRMQGLNRTLYTGCSVSFESVNDLVAYNNLLLDHVIRVEE